MSILIKRAIVPSLIAAAALSSYISFHGAIFVGCLILAGMYALSCAQRRMAMRFFTKQGFHHSRFAYALGPADLWWCGFVKHGTIACASGEEIDYILSMEGVPFGLLRTRATCHVALRDVQDLDEVARVLECLQQLKGVRSFDGSCSTMTDAEMTLVARLENLDTLALGHTRITDSGLAFLTRLSALRHLKLVKTDITNEGLKQLKRMNLQSVDLRFTDVSDEGLDHLRGTALCEINVEYTQTTAVGRAMLRAALPTCRIWPQD